jgi:myo-inositol 2-dehydrogenase/D-chiro-inositol 1-dehydrogenase
MSFASLQIGVIGVGGMGARHAHNLALHTPHAAVVAVMDLDMERAGEIAEACGGAKVYSAADALIKDPDVYAVVIAAPDPTHAGLAQACIAAGKSVLCEKPLATNVADAKTVMDLEVAAGRRFVQLGFMREFDHAHRQVRAVAHSGEMGRPLYFRGTHVNLREGGPRTVADVIINSAIHDIHSARWLLSGRVTEVFTRYMPAPDGGADSCRLALIELAFEGGELALLEVNADGGYGYEVRVEVTCERGTAAADGLDATRLRRQLTAAQTVEKDWLERFDQAYRSEAQAWVQAVRAGVPNGPSTWDGYISMVIADACIASARSGRPEAVPEIVRPALYA